MLLISNLIISFIQSNAGSDIYVSSMINTKDLPEANLRSFLNEQVLLENPIVYDYAFGSRTVYSFLARKTGRGYLMQLQNGGSFPAFQTRLRPIEVNYLNSSFIDFYTPLYLQKNITYPITQGKEDVIWSLYSDEGTTPFIGTKDNYNITSVNLSHNLKDTNPHGSTSQIKIVVPEGIKSVLSIDSGDTILLRFEYGYQVTNYR